MKTVIKTLAVQAAIVVLVVGGYFLHDIDKSIHQARLVGLAAKTIFAPRGKSEERDQHVAFKGKARLATKVFGDWMAMNDLEMVYEAVAGPERYVAVYVDPETGDLKKYTTDVQWRVMGERYPYNPPAMTAAELVDAVSAGTTVITDNRDFADDREITN